MLFTAPADAVSSVCSSQRPDLLVGAFQAVMTGAWPASHKVAQDLGPALRPFNRLDVPHCGFLPRGHEKRGGQTAPRHTEHNEGDLIKCSQLELANQVESSALWTGFCRSDPLNNARHVGALNAASGDIPQDTGRHRMGADRPYRHRGVCPGHSVPAPWHLTRDRMPGR